VEFTLTYDGPLATNGRPKQKHDIRVKLHPQLKELWQHQPLLQFRDMRGPNLATVGGHDFDSIVHPRWGFQSRLEILMLRPEAPGGIVTHGGDIDNRLKTLFDALTRPAHVQDLPKDWSPATDEDPLHCLLDDDSLITGVTVSTDRLLAAATPHVKLIIRVHVLNTSAFGGPGILG
jgi:hypothetical protein